MSVLSLLKGAFYACIVSAREPLFPQNSFDFILVSDQTLEEESPEINVAQPLMLVRSSWSPCTPPWTCI